MKKLYMIDCIAIHKISYCVEVDEITQLGEITRIINEGDHELEEFSQEFLGEKVVSNYHIFNDEYVKIFDKDNEYLKDWNTEKKLEFINKIN